MSGWAARIFNASTSARSAAGSLRRGDFLSALRCHMKRDDCLTAGRKRSSFSSPSRRLFVFVPFYVGIDLTELFGRESVIAFGRPDYLKAKRLRARVVHLRIRYV